MKKKSYLALLLAGGMLAQPLLSASVPLEAKAAGETWVSVEELTNGSVAAPEKDQVVPSQNQYEYQKQELAAFCHFGMNTYTGKEWGNGQEQPSQFQLNQPFDAENYVKAIAEAGFKKIIVTAKHHDGFCIWPSEHTEHDTKTAGYDGDVLAEISTACTKYKIDMGLYLSPWDVNSKYYGYYDENNQPLLDSTGNPKNGKSWEEVEKLDVLDYNDYYNNQLKEILGDPKYGNNGRFKEVWMDGAIDDKDKSKFQKYDFNKWFKTIQEEEGAAAEKFDDDCLQFGSGAHTTVHWIGNEAGFANEKTWAKINVDKDKNTFNSNKQGDYAIGYPDGEKWSVPEADTKITSGWFWGPNKKTPHSMEQLADIYFRSVGHNATLLLNVPPNTDGTVDQDILVRVKEFGDAIKGTFDDNLAKDATIKASNVRGNDTDYSPANVLDGEDNTYWTVEDGKKTAQLLIELKETKTFDVVSIEEAIQFGQRIGSFKVEYKNGSEEWKTFDQGTTIGAKRLCRKSAVKADKLKITVTADDAAEHQTPMLSEVGIYQAAEGFEVGNGIPSGLEVVDERDEKITYSGEWGNGSNEQALNGTTKFTKQNGATAQFTFKGTKAWIVGTIDPGHGKADVFIDNKKVATIDTNAKNRKMQQRIFESETLTDGEHTIKIEKSGNDGKALGLDGVLVLNNGGKGMIEIEKDSYRVNEDTKMPITLKRVGGTNGEVKVKFEVNPGSAWQRHFNADGNMEVTFADGQETAQAYVTTKRVLNKEGDLYFTANLSGATEGAITGFITKTKITIADTESYSKADLEKKVAEIEKQYKDAETLYTTSSYAELQKALKDAKNLLKTAHPVRGDLAKAGSALDVAVASLVERQVFSEKDAFVLPKIQGTKKSVEAEYFVLERSADAEDHVKIVIDDKASNGKKVGWMKDGDKVKLPFVAEKAGTYTFKATYQSGRNNENPNLLKWSGTNIESGEKTVTGTQTDGQKYETLDISIKVTAPGAGELIFTTDTKEGPNLDKFEVTAAEVSSANYDIEVKAGENGSVTYGEQTIVAGITKKVSVAEGATPTFTFVPNTKPAESADESVVDYAVAEVTVDGVPVGPQEFYTFEGITEAGHSIAVTFEKAIYDEESRFVFPIDGRTKTLEAERFQLFNTGENEEWPLQITSKDWASGKKFVNAMNSGDQIKLYYNAEQTGEYRVTLYYRSGSETNALSWAEESGNIEAKENVSAGAAKAEETKTVQFTWNVIKEGPGCLVLTAPAGNSPQLDKFEIESTRPEIPPANTQGLKALLERAEEINQELDSYKDGGAKENFKKQLEAAKALMTRIDEGELVLQEEVDEMAQSLKEVMETLELKEQKPTADKSMLEKAIAKAENLKLSDYQEEGKAEFAEALANAKEVMENEKATDETVSAALLRLNAAMANLKLIDAGSGDSGNTGNGGNENNGNSGNSGSGSSQNTGNSSAVKTGDAQNPFVYIMTMILAAVILLGAKKKCSK